MILFTDQNGTIDGGTVPFINLPMCENDETLRPDTEPGQVYGDIGSDEDTLVYANHIHPFDGACFKDAEYQEFINMKKAAEEWIEQKTEKDITTGIFNSGILTVLTDVISAMMFSSIPFSATFVNIIIMILNASYNLGIKEIDIDGLTYNISQVIETIRAKYQ